MIARQPIQLFIGVLRLMRPYTCIASGLTVAISARICDCGFDYRIIAGALAAALIAGAGNIFNDLLDINIDLINKPQRPLPSNQVSIPVAALAAIMLVVFGLILAVIAGRTETLLSVLAVVCLIAYSIYLKRIIIVGNLLVAVLGGILFIFAISSCPASSIGYVAAIIMIPGVLGREILKTVPDHEGDKKYGLRTVTTVLGAIVAKRMFSLLIIISFVGATALGLYGRYHAEYFIVNLALWGLIISIVYWLLIYDNATTIKRALIGSKYIYMIWIISLVASKGY